ncbi:RRXRR domain-containing protein [Scytonema sp. PRP1]|uniref:RRXRR domain-containing protein n=1 Tax=Scytonema sp. PRP1 TaxID=3120513 RepID=UPI002FCE7EEB
MRIPVVDKDNQPLMPTTPARARKWVESGKAVKRWSKCGQFYKLRYLLHFCNFNESKNSSWINRSRRPSVTTQIRPTILGIAA